MSEQRDQAITDLFESRQGKIRNFIRSKVRNLAQVEDLLQDVFAQLVRMYDNVESVDAWLFTVARNKINDYYRKKSTVSIDDIPTFESDEEQGSLSEQYPDSDLLPDDLFLREAMWEELEGALEELPAAQREAFVLNEFEGIPMKVIAEQQGTNINTVLSRKRYAVKYLQQKLEHFYNDLEI